MPDSGITKNALSTALKELMLLHPLAKISVGDICARCGMNRKSFYYHFKDKYDLVNWIFHTEFFHLLQVQLPEDADDWAAILCLCEYFSDNKEFYRNALSVQGQNSFYEFFGETIANIIRPEITASIDNPVHSEFYTNFFTDAFRGVILRWLSESEKLPPQEFICLLHNAVYSISHRVLTEKNNDFTGGAK